MFPMKLLKPCRALFETFCTMQQLKEQSRMDNSERYDQHFGTRDRPRTNETKDSTQKNQKMSTTNPQKNQVTFQQVVGKRRPKQTYRKH